jgi:hypothetical protein
MAAELPFGAVSDANTGVTISVLLVEALFGDNTGVTMSLLLSDVASDSNVGATLSVLYPSDPKARKGIV